LGGGVILFIQDLYLKIGAQVVLETSKIKAEYERNNDLARAQKDKAERLREEFELLIKKAGIA
jgi:hypothetical protein